MYAWDDGAWRYQLLLRGPSASRLRRLVGEVTAGIGATELVVDELARVELCGRPDARSVREEHGDSEIPQRAFDEIEHAADGCGLREIPAPLPAPSFQYPALSRRAFDGWIA